MADPLSWTMIEQGWSVVDPSGSEIGRVNDVLGDEDADIFNGLEILTGAFAKKKYVPAESVGDIVEGRVELLVTKEDVKRG
jgi:uncharacterized protein YrrD